VVVPCDLSCLVQNQIESNNIEFMSYSAAATKRLEVPKVSTSSQLFQSPRERTLLLSLLLTVVVLVAYCPVVQNRFVDYDDRGYITDNPHVRAGLTRATVKWAFTAYYQANWHPLTWLSHALDCQVFGVNPVGHHYVNVLLHAANVVVLFLLLQSATGFRWRSLTVAALFALHPVNVESVAWAAERKNVLSMFFFLLALYAYVWYRRRPGRRRYLAVASLFALSLLSKPQVVTFPFLLLLWDYWPLHRFGASVVDGPVGQAGNSSKFGVGRLVLEKVPLLLLSAASALVTMKAQTGAGAVQPFSQHALLFRLENALISYVRYMGKAVWPSKLAVLYVHVGPYPGWQVGAAAVLLLLVTAWTLHARQQPYLAVGWFWFLGSLVPMIGLVQVGSQAMADRYAYVPFIGLFLMLVWMVADRAEAYRIPSAYLSFSAVACLLLLGTLTCRQVGYWHDTASLWEHALAVDENSYGAQNNLASFLLSQGRVEEAGVHYRAALAIVPNGPTATLGLGDDEERRGDLSAAVGLFELVARRAADADTRATGYDRLGFVYRRMGQLVKAKQCFESALQLAPDRAKAMTGLGLIAQQSGDLPEAVRQYSHAVAIEPTDIGYLLLAQALQREGHLDDANAIYEQMAHFSLDLAEAQKAAQLLLSAK
jgi:tetratricopeptide (TPR) repeat protein